MTTPGWGFAARDSRLTRQNLWDRPVLYRLALDSAGWSEHASASGALAALALIAATGVGAGVQNATGSGSLAQLTLSAPAAYASGGAVCSGSLATIALTAPTGAGSAVSVIPSPWSLSGSAPNASFSGSAPNVSLTGSAPNGAFTVPTHNLAAVSVMRGPTYTTDMAIIGTLNKQPAETLLIEADFSAHVGTRTLTSMTVTPTVPVGLTQTDTAQAGPVYQLWVAGGSHLTTYKITLTASFLIGGHTEVVQDEIMVLVEEV